MTVRIFIICAACGAASGIFYDLLYLARTVICGGNGRGFTLKYKITAGVSDIAYFTILAVMYIFCAVKNDFPDIRLYMPLAVFCGILLYINSFHRAFSAVLSAIYRKKRQK